MSLGICVAALAGIVLLWVKRSASSPWLWVVLAVHLPLLWILAQLLRRRCIARSKRLCWPMMSQVLVPLGRGLCCHRILVGDTLNIATRILQGMVD